ncbi:MAG: plastocyanin/azurin family copper-binding protein [Gemmatimonadaceae bacterium]
MRFNGLALIASAVVLGACSGGDKTETPADTATMAPTPSTTPATTGMVAKAPATGKTWEVKMIGDGTTYKFEPANLTIKAGDNVKWMLVSGQPHNVAFDPAEVMAAAKPQLMANMDSQMSELSGPLLMNAGDAYEMSFANVPAGKYNYYCTPHLAMNMRGTITVQ